ncbi:MAG: class I SAM-dependent methyltransferase [Candidatus Thermoplasmatota archaeon]
MAGPYARFAKYYDLVYEELLDYRGDCDSLEALFRRFLGTRPRSVLDLGCGTGNHAVILGERGYDVLGLDRSRPQLAVARAKVDGRSLPVSFVQKDMRRFDLRRRFDAAICMFGGFGYLLTDRDVVSHFVAVRRHLAAAGLYVFEFWQESGVIPGHKGWVLRERPFRIIRLDRSTHDPRRHRLSVEFRFFVFDRDRLRERFGESHVLRLYRTAEIRRLLARGGMRLVAAYAGRQRPGRFPAVRENSFAVLAVARPGARS